jgi:hypothetical protein
MNRLFRYLWVILIVFSILVMSSVPALADNLPDLQTQQIGVTNLYAGVNNTVSVVIDNNGNFGVDSFEVKLEAADSGGSFLEVESKTGNSISSHNDPYYWPLSVNFSWKPAETGNYSLRVTVDPANEVAESDENNNTLEQSEKVKELTPVTIQVRIEGKASTIWNGQVTFSDSTITDKQGNTYNIDHPTALGALAAAADIGGFNYVVSSAYGPLTYLESIGGDDSQGANGWLYLNNWHSPSVAAVDYSLADNDEILWYYGGWAAKPLKISADVSSLTEMESMTATVKAYDGTSWNAVKGAEVRASSFTFTTGDNGETSVALPAGSYTLFATKGNYETYIRSNPLEIKVDDSVEQVYPLKADDTRILDALAYLRQAQKSDGSIGDFVPSCWAVMAVAAAGQDPDTWTKGNNSVVTYLEKKAASNVEASKATDVERLILSIVAAEKNPRSFGGTNYIQILLSLYDGVQMGDITLLNDDFWAILALEPAGEDPEVISKIKENIIRNQNSDGGWSWAAGGESDADNTAAALSALIKAGVAKDDQVIVAALVYLKTQQQGNGGFISEGSTNSAVDAWVIRSLRDTGQNPVGTDWAIGEKNPISHLLSLQDTDGAFKWTSSTKSRPEWMTAYAITALLGAEWPEDKSAPVLSAFKPASGSKTSSTSPSIGASYSDIVSGIDKSAVELWLDGNRIQNASIGLTSVSYKTKALAIGDHSIKVSVSDKNNNLAEKSWTFKVVKASSGGGGGGSGTTPAPSPFPSPTTSTVQIPVSQGQSENVDLEFKDNHTIEAKVDNFSGPGSTTSSSQLNNGKNGNTITPELNKVDTAAAVGLNNGDLKEIPQPQTSLQKDTSVNWVLFLEIGGGVLITVLIVGMILNRKKTK